MNEICLKKININIEFSKDLITDSYVDYNLDNTFCVFKSINNILYLIYSNYNNSIISYSIIENKKVNEIKNAHDCCITNFRHYYDQLNKRDLIISISCENNNIKLWDINNLFCLSNIEYINEKGYLFSAFLLKDYNNQIYIISSNAYDNPEPIKIFDLNGNFIKHINNSNDITYFIDTYYEYVDNKLNEIYIISGNQGNIKAYKYSKNDLYFKYCDNDNKGHCSIIIYKDNFSIIKLIESGFDGIIRIWNFHSGILLNKIIINNFPLYGICLWNNNYLFIGCKDKTIKILDLKSNNIIKELKGHNNRVSSIKIIKYQINEEFLISQGFDNEEIKLWNIKNKI